MIDSIVNELSLHIGNRGMTIPAIFLLEMYKPLSTVFYNSGLISMPLLMPIFGRERYKDALSFLETRENIEKLILKLEENQKGLREPVK